jgi:hypothetical protein
MDSKKHKQQQPQQQEKQEKQQQPQPKRALIVDSHVISYLGDYMIHLKESLKNAISYRKQQQSSQSKT